MTVTVLVDPETLREAEISIEGDTYRHLFRARRGAVGDEVRVVDGKGAAFWAVVESVRRSDATLRVGEEAPVEEPRVRVEILSAAPRPERQSWLVEKATELGVAAVRFLALERAPRAVGRPQLARLERVARAALQQSGGAVLPEITGAHGLSEVLSGAPPSPEVHTIALCPGGAPILQEIEDVRARALRILVGPEGGWSDRESKALDDHGIPGVGLGPRVLRVETAAVVAAGLVVAASEASGRVS